MADLSALTHLRDYQRDALGASLAAFDRGVWSQLMVSAVGSGKAQPLDEPVLTPAGWRPIGELRVGDSVIGGNGQPCRVTGVFPQGIRSIRHVVTDDGAEAFCDAEHLWTVRPALEHRGGPQWRTMTTDQIMVSGEAWYLPLVAPIDYGGRPESLPLDPYLLGVLIGDGGLSIDGRVLVTTHDDVVDLIRSLLPAPCTITRQAQAGTATTWIIGGPVGRSNNPTMSALRYLGLMGCKSVDKFIPPAYLRGSAADRLALLQGLCDTDGHVASGAVAVEWTTASERLAQDVVTLVRSLGGKPRLTQKRTTWTHRGLRRYGVAWRLMIRLEHGQAPVRVARKRDRIATATRPLARKIARVSIRRPAEAVCIAVDGPDSLYVTRDYLVTHNTVIFAHLRHAYAEWLAQFPALQQKVLVLAHRDRLIDQAAQKIARYNPGLRIGIEMAGRRHSPFDDVVVGSVQTLGHRNHSRLSRLNPDEFRIIVIDEAHRSAAPTYQYILRYFGLLPPLALVGEPKTEAAQAEARTRVRAWWADNWPNRLLLGVTATPGRSDAIGLEWTYREVVYERPLRWYIERGYLAPLTGFLVKTHVSLASVRQLAGDFNQQQLAPIVNTPGRNRAVVYAWQQAAAGRRATLAFCVDVAHACDLAAEFRRAGVAADSIAGADEDRHARLASFERGDLQVLTNCQLLSEGTDIPAIDCVIMAAPTQSQTRYMQAIGRGSRLSPATGKVDCLVLDICDDARKYAVQTVGDIFGLPRRFNALGGSLLAAAQAIEAASEARGLSIDVADLTPETLTVTLQRIDLWTAPASPTIDAHGTLSWSELSPGRFTLPLPPLAEGGALESAARALPEVVIIEPGLLGDYDVRVRVGAQVSEALGAGLDVAAAFARAERWVEHHRPDVYRMKQRAARWRDREASEKQLAALRRQGAIVPAAGLTRGQASDMLDTYFARRRRA